MDSVPCFMDSEPLFCVMCLTLHCNLLFMVILKTKCVYFFHLNLHIDPLFCRAIQKVCQKQLRSAWRTTARWHGFTNRFNGRRYCRRSNNTIGCGKDASTNTTYGKGQKEGHHSHDTHHNNRKALPWHCGWINMELQEPRAGWFISRHWSSCLLDQSSKRHHVCHL